MDVSVARGGAGRARRARRPRRRRRMRRSRRPRAAAFFGRRLGDAPAAAGVAAAAGRRLAILLGIGRRPGRARVTLGGLAVVGRRLGVREVADADVRARVVRRRDRLLVQIGRASGHAAHLLPELQRARLARDAVRELHLHRVGRALRAAGVDLLREDLEALIAQLAEPDLKAARVVDGLLELHVDRGAGLVLDEGRRPRDVPARARILWRLQIVSVVARWRIEQQHVRRRREGRSEDESCREQADTPEAQGRGHSPRSSTRPRARMPPSTGAIAPR